MGTPGISIKVTYTVTLLTTVVTKFIIVVIAFNQTNIRIVSLSCLFYIKIVIYIHINPRFSDNFNILLLHSANLIFHSNYLVRLKYANFFVHIASFVKCAS